MNMNHNLWRPVSINDKGAQGGRTVRKINKVLSSLPTALD